MKQPKPGWVQMEMKSSGSRYLQLLKLIYNCEDHFLFYELLLITRGCIFFFSPEHSVLLMRSVRVQPL